MSNLNLGFDSAVLEMEIKPTSATLPPPFPSDPPPKTTRAVCLGEGEEPGEREWMVDKLIPTGHLTILSGDGGTGKSLLALQLAYCIALGEPLFGIPVTQGAVLWLDAEHLGLDEVKRRSFQVGRGWGEGRPPTNLYYYACDKPTGHPQTIREVHEIVKAHDIRLVVLDSLTIGAGGSDMSNQGDVVALLREFFTWGVTVFALDHITKAARESGQEKASIFGSVHKRNMARSTLRLYLQEGSLFLAQDKSNFGPVQPKIQYGVEFVQDDDGRAVVNFLQAEQGPMFSMGMQVMTAANKTLMALRKLSDGKVDGRVTVAEIAQERGCSEKTIQNNLAELRKSDDVVAYGDGYYSPNDAIV